MSKWTVITLADLTVRFVVPGQPQGKGRPRFSTYAGRVHTRTPEATVIYENLIKTEYQIQCGSHRFQKDVPLYLCITAYYSIPQSKSKHQQALMQSKSIRPTKKPDWDNIGKVVADSLNGIAYHDDAQIVESVVRKFYSHEPRVEVIIKEANTI